GNGRGAPPHPGWITTRHPGHSRRVQPFSSPFARRRRAGPSTEPSLMSTQRQTSAVAVAEPATVTDRTFAHHGAPASDLVDWFTRGLAQVMSAAGYQAQAEPGPDVQVVLHVVDLARP